MAFSEFLQVGMGALGMIQAGQAYRSGLRAQYEALANMKNQEAFNMGAYLDSMRAQTEENEYRRMIEAMNRGIAQDERQFQIGQYDNYLDQLLAERAYGINRQTDLDRAAAQERAFQLQQLLRNQNLSAKERAFALEQLSIAQGIAQNERDLGLDIYSEEAARFADRQSLADQQAKEIQLYRLQEASKNRALLEDERAFAREMLGYAQDTAASERQWQLGKLAQDEATKEGERNFFLDQYDAYIQQMQSERDAEMGLRDQIMAGASNLENALRATASQFGYIPEVRQVTPEMIDAEVARRTGQYQSDVDRAAQMVASSGEADLIRAGMDVSTLGTQRRGEIAGRLATEYENARRQAYDDALGYISGQNQAMNSQIAAEMQRQNALLEQTMGIAGTELGILQNLKALPSAASAYQMAGYAPSAILDRSIVSANNYSAPVALNSALYSGGMDAMTSGISNYDYNLMNLMSGIKSANNYSTPVAIGSGIYDKALSSMMGTTLSPSSAASTAYSNISSGIYNPISLTLQNPSSYLSNAINSQNSYNSQLLGRYNQGYDRLSDASSNFGGMLQDLILDNKDKLDEWGSGMWDRMFG